MRQKVFRGACAVAAAGALIVPSAASAATSRQMYKDYVDNGRLDQRYSTADIQRALDSATVQAYSNSNFISDLKGQLQAQGAVAGNASGALPFTGAQLALWAIVGCALLTLGFALRSSGRPRQKT